MSFNYKGIIEKYAEACSTADQEGLLEVLDPDVAHYFTNPKARPIRGAEEFVKLFVRLQSIKSSWVLDNILTQDDQVVVEFTHVFFSNPEDPSTKTINRGSEWYRFRDGKICEVRAYFQNDTAKDTGLTDYPYELMGYTTKNTDTQ